MVQRAELCRKVYRLARPVDRRGLAVCCPSWRVAGFDSLVRRLTGGVDYLVGLVNRR